MHEKQVMELTRRLKILHLRLAQEGPTDRTGEALKSLADFCEPARKFVDMWESVAGPFARRQAALAAIGEAIGILK